jgi:hypothetical protein
MVGELVDMADKEKADGHVAPEWMDIMGRVAGRGEPHGKRAFAMLESAILDTKLKYRPRLSAFDSLRRHVVDDRTRAVCKKVAKDPDPAVKDTATTCLRQYAEADARAAASGSAAPSAAPSTAPTASTPAR